MLKALSRQREARYQSARELGEALSAVIQSTGLRAGRGELSTFLKKAFAAEFQAERAWLTTASRLATTPTA